MAIAVGEGVTAPAGFHAAGIACGIKLSGDPDLALVATADRTPVSAAGVFTSNLATAAPVQTSRAHLATTNGTAVAVVLNSGNANAATGDSGRKDAARTCEMVAEHLGCRPEEVLVCSTGLIGIPLPMAPVETGAGPLVRALHEDGGGEAARAIMTTDTVPKQVTIEADGFSVGGMAKGAAMLAPNMATMLAVLTTDAAAEPATLTAMLQLAVSRSFNTLSVDGCQSTNDTVLVLANGVAGAVSADELQSALDEACRSLAEQMAGDAEGATKVVRVKVIGAADDPEASAAARRIAESQLCKCSWYGEDPYWGRVVSEAGSAGVRFDPDLVSVAYGSVVVAQGGVAVEHDTESVREHMAGRRIDIQVDLGLGDGRGEILTNDLTHAYIDENMGTS